MPYCSGHQPLLSDLLTLRRGRVVELDRHHYFFCLHSFYCLLFPSERVGFNADFQDGAEYIQSVFNVI